MSATLTQATFIARVLRRLNEAATSPVGELTDGSGGVTLTTAQAIADYASEAASILSRTCLPLRGSFTLAVSTVTRTVRYSDLATGTDTPTGAVIWQAIKDGVIWTQNAGSPVRLTFCTEASLSMRDRDYLTAAAGTPTYWYPLGAEGIGVYPAIGQSGTLTVHGLSVAPPASGTGAMFPAIPDDVLSPYVEAYVCGRLALKNSEDATLGQKASVWLTEWDLGRKSLHDRLDPGLSAYFPPFTPTPQPTVGSAQ